MQGVTKNSLADSGLLGINSGAAVGLAVAFILFPSLQPNQAALFSFLGAFLATSFYFVDEVFKDRYDADWIDSSRCCIEFFFFCD